MKEFIGEYKGHVVICDGLGYTWIEDKRDPGYRVGNSWLDNGYGREPLMEEARRRIDALGGGR